MPEYLRFVKGVIDSEDIPLNISRETIQNHIIIDKIKKHILKKLFEHLAKLKEKDREKYLKIWKNFQRNLKEGVVSDFENKSKLGQLMLFHSSKKGKDETIDLQEYVKGMAKDQKEIYYVSGMNYESLQNNPALEAFNKKKYEVLYLLDPMDEFVMDHLRSFEGKNLKVVESADIKLDKDEEEDKDYLKDVDSFVVFLKTIFGERVAEVKVSKRLVDSPCLLVHAADGPSIQMEKIMKMTNKDYQFAKKIFEINPANNLIKEMIRIHKASPMAEGLKNLALQLLDNMLLREGVVDDLDTIIPRIQDIMFAAAKSIKK